MLLVIIQSKLAKKAVKNKVNYLALGSFFKSKLKPNAKKADLKVLKQVKKKYQITNCCNWWNK